MNRRELLAGGASLGLLATGVGLVRYGPALFAPDESAPEEDDESAEVTTIDARGSTAGSVPVPADGTVSVAMFFITACGNCQSQVPEFAAARNELRDEYGDAVRFLALSYQRPDALSDDELRDWWATHGGDGYVGYDDGLAGQYPIVGYPASAVIGPTGDLHWWETDVVNADTIVTNAAAALEAAGLEQSSESSE